MQRSDVLALVVVLTIALLATAGVAGALRPLSQEDGAGGDATGSTAGATPTNSGLTAAPSPQSDNRSVPPGGLVSSVIGMEASSVDGTVSIERLRTRFSAATTDSERARVIASALQASRQQVTALENRRDTLETRRANGSISQGWFDVERSWLLAAAENQALVTGEIERRARRVDANELARRNATVEQIGQLRDRIDRLQSSDPPEIHQTTFDRSFYRDLAAFFERFNEAADSRNDSERRALFDNNRVNLYIESDAGPPAVLSVRATADGRIVDLRAGEHPDATVRMELSEGTAGRLIDSETPREAFRTARSEGEISITEIRS